MSVTSSSRREKPRGLISPIYLAPVLIILMIIFHFVFPIQMMLEFPFTLIGVAPIVVGLFINLQATRTLTENNPTLKSSENPKVLVTGGFFQYSRNPMDLGGIILGFGLAILLGSLVSFVFPAIFFLLLHFLFIPNEEKELKVMFGEEYLNYMKHVRKWI